MEGRGLWCEPIKCRRHTSLQSLVGIPRTDTGDWIKQPHSETVGTVPDRRETRNGKVRALGEKVEEGTTCR